ncbi:adenosylcobinamide-phosphate synthase CbiB [Acidiphilium sp.]|uniref:adenosylcobinamide-phosphate synthase CbiB n=1 Tax=Acidiphilium sp. TaxID=527 RepID=UPI003D023FA4
MTLLLAALALTIEAIIGYPDTIFRTIRHPVMWVGALIDSLDRGMNRSAASPRARRLRGVVALVVLIGAAAVPALAVQEGVLAVLPRPAGVVLIALLASALLASVSLTAHVRAVAEGLDVGLAEGRAAVSLIVGRDPDRLDRAGVARAAIESLAENFSDGVVAPALWCALLGLPGIAAYKAVNTADSMIGHLTPRHAMFGWAAARFDDVINLPASRLAAGWIILAAALQPGASARAALATVRRDAGKHRSPNAGWPEAAMAGALGLRLAGPRVYGAALVEDAWMGDGRAEATVADIRRALRLYHRAAWLQIGVAWLLAAVIVAG